MTQKLLLGQVEAIPAVASQLSVQSDRYLFLASLLVMGALAMVVARYFVNQYESLLKDHKESREKLLADHKESRDAHQGALARMVSDHNVTAQNLAVVLDRNTCALDENTEEIRRCREGRERGRGD